MMTEEQAEEGELQGDRKSLSNQIGHVVGRANAVGAEVTVEHVPQVVTVLNEEGVVETVLHTVLFESFGGRGLTQCRVGGVNRRQRHDEEDEEGHADHHDRQSHQTSSDESQKVIHC